MQAYEDVLERYKGAAGGTARAGRPGGVAGWRPPRRRGWPGTCSFSGQLICGVEISLRETALSPTLATLAALLSGRVRARGLPPEPRRRRELPGRRRSRAGAASRSAPSVQLLSPRLGRPRARPGALAPLCLPQSPRRRVAAGVGECALLGRASSPAQPRGLRAGGGGGLPPFSLPPKGLPSTRVAAGRRSGRAAPHSSASCKA